MSENLIPENQLPQVTNLEDNDFVRVILSTGESKLIKKSEILYNYAKTEDLTSLHTEISSETDTKINDNNTLLDNKFLLKNTYYTEKPIVDYVGRFLISSGTSITNTEILVHNFVIDNDFPIRSCVGVAESKNLIFNKSGKYIINFNYKFTFLGPYVNNVNVVQLNTYINSTLKTSDRLKIPMIIDYSSATTTVRSLEDGFINNSLLIDVLQNNEYSIKIIGYDTKNTVCTGSISINLNGIVDIYKVE